MAISENKVSYTELLQTGDDHVRDIDERLNLVNMNILLIAEMNKNGDAGHHIAALNDFYSFGFKQIICEVYKLEGRIKNERKSDDEDRSINEISYSVKFTDARLAKPTTIVERTSAVIPLLPNAAIKSNLNYSCNLSIDAEITLTAYYHDGTTKTRVFNMIDQPIGSVPCMVKSIMCTTYKLPHESLIELGEDPHDIGGYVVLGGQLYSLDAIENLAYNMPSFHINNYRTELVRGQFLSKGGDAFENSYQVILRYHNNSAITVEMTMDNKSNIVVPFYVIFRALGMTSMKDIIDHIVEGVSITNVSSITRMKTELEKAYKASAGEYEPIRNTTNHDDIILFIMKKINPGINVKALDSDENIRRHFVAKFLAMIDIRFFPHMGGKPDHRIVKLRFLAHLINNLLLVAFGEVPPTRRDRYDRKRVVLDNMGKAFKTNFNHAVINEFRRNLEKGLAMSPFSAVQPVNNLKNAVGDKLQRLLEQSITTGNGTVLRIRKTEISNHISSQLVNKKNALAVTNIACIINTSTNNIKSKNSERSDQLRRVDATYPYVICVSQSHESSSNVGTSKGKTVTVTFSRPTSSFALKRDLMNDELLIKLDDVAPAQISLERLTKVMVNGAWIGCCRNSREFADKFKYMRRKNIALSTISCARELDKNELYIWTDGGRPLAPFVIVYNNSMEWEREQMAGNVDFQFKQWITLTYEHLMALGREDMTVDNLIEQGVIEYISPDEMMNSRIAPNIRELRAHKNDPLERYTHCGIDASILSILALAAPLGNHTNSLRNTLFMCHLKQCVAWPCGNFPHTVLKTLATQFYCEQPIVTTITNSRTKPIGLNVRVAVLMHSGQNCEDGLIVNKASADTGRFAVIYDYCEKVELEAYDQIGNIDNTKTLGVNQDTIYSHVVDGVVKPGTIVHKNYALVVKFSKLANPSEGYLYRDTSAIYKKSVPAEVVRVVQTINKIGMKTFKIQLRNWRPLADGEKLASRTGNKGIVARVEERKDMPFDEEGKSPDIIVNPHSIPTRMAINQIIECAMAQLGAKAGAHMDATPFLPRDTDALAGQLEKWGIKCAGYKRYYSGITGDAIDTLVFEGPTTYMRLGKFLDDEHYSVRIPHTDPLTRQPVAGKARGGSNKTGELEVWAYESHGIMRALHEKIYKDSDGTNIYICRTCGKRAIVNEKNNIYRCQYCPKSADIACVSSSWINNLFFNELSAMNAGLTFGLEPYTYNQQMK